LARTRSAWNADGESTRARSGENGAQQTSRNREEALRFEPALLYHVLVALHICKDFVGGRCRVKQQSLDTTTLE
jgi:hypothetical protein